MEGRKRTALAREDKRKLGRFRVSQEGCVAFPEIPLAKVRKIEY
jgi:hypothetical protein